MKTARRGEEWRYEQLVRPDDANRDGARHRYLPLHFSITFLSARSRSANGAESAVRRGLSTMSHRGSNSARCRRNASRKRRLMRFRTTLPPIARGTVSPNRAAQPSLPSGRARQKAANKGPETRVPWSYTLRKSAVRRALDVEEAGEDTGEQMGAPPPAGSTGFRVADGLLVAYGQLVTAAGPAARQHGPSVFGLHALAKSVRFGALAIVRLKCPFRHIGLRSARNAQCEGASPVGSFIDMSSITNGSPWPGVPCFQCVLIWADAQ